jgi:hypothetical protein
MFTWNWTVFFLGAIGAFAPEILRLWSIRANKQKFGWSAFYLAASILMCVLGGVVALCLQPDSAWKALYGGITAPVLISSASKRVPGGRRQKLKGAAPNDISPSARGFFEAL